MAVVTGNLSDFGLASIAAFNPRVTFRASGPAVEGSRLYVTRPIHVTPSSGGAFSVELRTTAAMHPLVWYEVTVQWQELDADGKPVPIGYDFPGWKLFVPVDGGPIGDLIEAPSNPQQAAVQPDPPANPTPGTWWLDTDNGDLREWSGSMWTLKTNIQGPQGPQGEQGPVGPAGTGQAMTDEGIASNLENVETASHNQARLIATDVLTTTPGVPLDFRGAMTNLMVARPVWAGSVRWFVPVNSPVPRNLSVAHGDILVEAEVEATAWNPLWLTGLHRWFDAHTLTLADGASMSNWPAAFGSAAASTSAGFAQPTYRATAFGGKPAVQFNGVDQAFRNTVTGYTGVTTMYVVGQSTPATLAASDFFVDGYDGTTIQRLGLSRGTTNFAIHRGSTLTGPAGDNLRHRFKALYNGATSAIQVDDQTPVTGSTQVSPTISSHTIAARGDGANFLEGFIAEVIIVRGTVSPEDEALLYGYLDAKHGL